MRVYLIGFMGCGKSHTGKKLASLLGAPFIDLDDYVEQRAGTSIKTIFATHGEGYFRELEQEVLQSLNVLPSFVMATGGGTPCYRDTIDRLNEIGTTVFLDATVDVLLRRLTPDTSHRPLLDEKEPFDLQIAVRLHERRPEYEKAAIHVKIDSDTIDTAQMIMEKLAYNSSD